MLLQTSRLNAPPAERPVLAPAWLIALLAGLVGGGLWLLYPRQDLERRLAASTAGSDIAPLILDTYANTASAGSVIAFHEHRADLQRGDLGVICSFGAGYSVGSVVVRKR